MTFDFFVFHLVRFNDSKIILCLCHCLLCVCVFQTTKEKPEQQRFDTYLVWKNLIMMMKLNVFVFPLHNPNKLPNSILID